MTHSKDNRTTTNKITRKTQQDNQHEYKQEDYNDWETEWFAWGALMPYYSQLGKNLREVFEDGDEYIASISPV